MMTGTGQFGPIEMGGIFTIIKIRDGLTSYEDPGWYQNPPGTVASSISGLTKHQKNPRTTTTHECQALSTPTHSACWRLPHSPGGKLRRR